MDLTKNCNFEPSVTHTKSDKTGAAHLSNMQSDAVNDDSDQAPKASWRSLFNIASNLHAICLTLAILLSVASGVIIPTLAVLLGKVFDVFTNYGEKHISGPDLLAEVSKYGVALIALGCASGILNATYFMSWVVFGELQAKSVNEKLFDGMVDKDMAWYDTCTTGIETLISRLQM